MRMRGRAHARLAAVNAAVQMLMRRYRTHACLSDADVDVFSSLNGPLSDIRPRAELVSDGAGAAEPRFLAIGWACRQRVLRDGRRQILGFILPGDAIGFTERPATSAIV